MNEPESLRRYRCARCHTEVLICGHCDRGNQYCSGDCARMRRRQSLTAAQKRYQQTPQGRIKHRTRQRIYRAHKESVTHHSSKPKENSTLSLQEQRALVVTPLQQSGCDKSQPEHEVRKTSARPNCCHFCDKSSSLYVRLDFFRTKKKPLGVLRQ